MNSKTYVLCIARMLTGIMLACIFKPDTQEVINLITGKEIDPTLIAHGQIEQIAEPAQVTGSPMKYLGTPEYGRHIIGTKSQVTLKKN